MFACLKMAASITRENNNEDVLFQENENPRKAELAVINESKENNDVEDEHTCVISTSNASVYGHIKGVKVGTVWKTRAECSASGIHVPVENSIHEGPDGAFSIALCGDFKCELDYGDCFTWTCEEETQGVCMLHPIIVNETSAQHKLTLTRSFETGNPVRIIRGYELNTVYAPKSGYRYDGLYVVKKLWKRENDEKFALKRCEDQTPPPWLDEFIKVESSEVEDSGTNDSQDEVFNSISSEVGNCYVNNNEVQNSCINNHLKFNHVGSEESVEYKKLSSNVPSPGSCRKHFSLPCESNTSLSADSSETRHVFNIRDVRVILQKLSNVVGNTVIFKPDNGLKSCLKKWKTPTNKRVRFKDGTTKHVYSYDARVTVLNGMESKNANKQEELQMSVDETCIKSQKDNEVRVDIKSQKDNEVRVDIKSQKDNEVRVDIKSQKDNEVRVDIKSQKDNEVRVDIESQKDNEVRVDIESQKDNEVGVDIKSQKDNEIRVDKTKLLSTITSNMNGMPSSKTSGVKEKSYSVSSAVDHVQESENGDNFVCSSMNGNAVSADSTISVKQDDRELLSSLKNQCKKVSKLESRTDCPLNKRSCPTAPVIEKKARIITRRRSYSPHGCSGCVCITPVKNRSLRSRKRKSVPMNFKTLSRRKLVKSSPSTYTRMVWEKKFGHLLDCKVKLEKLSSSYINEALNGQKIPHMKENHKEDIQACIDLNPEHKNSRGNCFSNGKNATYNTSNHDTWKSIGIDSWGNVSCALKDKSTSNFDMLKYFSLCEPDPVWNGWQVRVDSLQSSCKAYLHSATDGVTESRILVWDDMCEEDVSMHSVVSKQEESINDKLEEVQCVDEPESDEMWLGWNVIMVDMNSSTNSGS